MRQRRPRGEHKQGCSKCGKPVHGKQRYCNDCKAEYMRNYRNGDKFKKFEFEDQKKEFLDFLDNIIFLGKDDTVSESQRYFVENMKLLRYKFKHVFKMQQ